MLDRTPQIPDDAPDPMNDWDNHDIKSLDDGELAEWEDTNHA